MEFVNHVLIGLDCIWWPGVDGRNIRKSPIPNPLFGSLMREKGEREKRKAKQKREKASEKRLDEKSKRSDKDKKQRKRHQSAVDDPSWDRKGKHKSKNSSKSSSDFKRSRQMEEM
ncbi:hypothetical protein VitviT2T_003730 [Vitis vinifera]|uniref:Uncharacterized protein n=1 Tax=Vitis vinifera TaxID=29760 RepID=A0ABY9BN45_VITVI|nr:hypothetical protein VitviT2T_003730 [Vitis vinifera]